jgi:lysozyme
MNKKVIDLSHHNTIDKDLSGAKAEGALGVIHKLTEGRGGVDEKVQARLSMAKDVGLLWGVYHFLRPDQPDKQVGFFLTKAEKLGVIDDNTLIACDFEKSIPLVDVLHFLQAIEKATDRSPVLYSGNYLKDEGGAPACPPIVRYRLWMPQYGPKAVLPKGYDKYFLWQYTDKGSIPGISGNVDLNHFDGLDEELIAQWNGKE